MRLILRTIFVLFLIIYPSLAVEISACQFHGINSVYESFNSATIVFTGKAIAEKIVGGDRLYRFEVKESFKSLDKKEVEIYSGSEDNRCEDGFTVGESYLIYAYGSFKEGFHSYNFGTLNEKLDNANDQIFLIKQFLKGKPEPQIYGSIARVELDKITKQIREINLQGVKVLIESKNKKFKAITDANGIYSFNKIPKGEYTLKPILPPSYKIYSPEEENFFVLKSGRLTRDLFAEVLITTNKKVTVEEENRVLAPHVQHGGYYEFLIELKEEVE